MKLFQKVSAKDLAQWLVNHAQSQTAEFVRMDKKRILTLTGRKNLSLSYLQSVTEALSTLGYYSAWRTQDNKILGQDFAGHKITDLYYAEYLDNRVCTSVNRGEIQGEA